MAGIFGKRQIKLERDGTKIVIRKDFPFLARLVLDGKEVGLIRADDDGLAFQPYELPELIEYVRKHRKWTGKNGTLEKLWSVPKKLKIRRGTDWFVAKIPNARPSGKSGRGD